MTRTPKPGEIWTRTDEDIEPGDQFHTVRVVGLQERGRFLEICFTDMEGIAVEGAESTSFVDHYHRQEAAS